jgi:cold shock CspA family protein
MRTHGTLTKWNDDRGFGFIKPAKGSSDIFVHISAFPRDGVRPRVDELISFEVEAAADGKLRAVRVMRPAQKRSPQPALPRDRKGSPGARVGRVLALSVVVALGAYGYSQYSRHVPAHQAAESEVAMPETFASPAPPASPYACDGRTMCPQMTSCSEAMYFIRNCPGTQMDGDGDGVPCESQWCN